MFKITGVFMLAWFIFSSSTVFAGTLLLVTLESPPAEYVDNGRPAGRNVEIVTEGLRRLGHGCRIEFLPWKRALKMVEDGTADGIIDVAYNKKRAEYLHYPDEAIYVEEWYCFKRKGSDLTLDRDLKNAGEIKLGVSRGFVYGGIIQEAIDKKLFVAIDEARNNELNIEKLVGKRFDMFVGVKSTILFLAAQMGYADKIEIVKMTGTDKPYLMSSSKTYLGFSKKTMNKEIAQAFSRVVAAMYKDGTIGKIDAKYHTD